MAQATGEDDAALAHHVRCCQESASVVSLIDRYTALLHVWTRDPCQKATCPRSAGRRALTGR